jgi:hypothetical protein
MSPNISSKRYQLTSFVSTLIRQVLGFAFAQPNLLAKLFVVGGVEDSLTQPTIINGMN